MKTQVLGSFIGKIPAGTYYFGDPCYCFGEHNAAAYTDADWSIICKASFSSTKYLDVIDGKLLLCPTTESVSSLYVDMSNGAWCVLAGTANGDGVFKHRPSGMQVGVDAGLLAIMSEAFAAACPRADELYARWQVNSIDRVKVVNGDWYVGQSLICRTSDA